MEKKIVMSVFKKSNEYHVKSIKLSKWGILRLTAFPREAIEWADSKIGYSPGGDQFRKFASLCLQWCNDNSIKANWKEMDDQCRIHNMPKNAPMILNESNSREEGINNVDTRVRRSLVLAENEVVRSGKIFTILSDVEHDKRIQECLNDPIQMEAYNSMVKVSGKDTAVKLFEKMLANLKYREKR